jgi:hypothetical protein
VDDRVNGAAQRFAADRLLADALAAAGLPAGDLSAFGRDDFVEPFSIVCRALGEEARLDELGRRATHRYLRRLLDVRIELHDLLAQDPGVADETIESPIFVIGAPRTGTTVVHRLMAADPSLRAPEAWELLRPVPPPEPDSFDHDPRIEAVSDELLFPQTRSSNLRAIHTYSARMPKECLSSMAISFRSEEFVSRYDVPSYVQWLQACDMTPAYDIHRLVLQVLQRRMPARRWVLKSPVHLQALPTLVATYSDASYVVTHRDPVAVLSSASSLVATVRAAFSAEVDPTGIGLYHTELYARSLDRLVDRVEDGTLPAERTVHVRHGDVVDDPVAAVSSVYARLGLELDRSVRSTIEAAAGEERDDAVGAHHNDPADFGIDPDAVRPRFARYIERFLPT